MTTIYDRCLSGIYNHQLIQRYRELIRVMKKLTPHEREHHFNMNSWGVKTDCGTVMCAAGFAGSDHWFRRQGFSFSKRDLEIHFHGRVSWRAIEMFFGYLSGDHNVYDAIGQRREMAHPVFGKPTSVDEVIAAAEERIRKLTHG